jgi:sterol desaturase/sphingolipid hydroxylase (fatty acid hydroxylase superfamily)
LQENREAVGPEIRMVNWFAGAAHETVKSLRIAAELLAYSALYFGFIALLVKGREAIDAARRAVAEVRFNLALYFLDTVFVAPMLAIAVTVIRSVVKAYSLGIVKEETWGIVGQPVTFVAVVLAGDFISYWRHRLEHTRWLWPAHAIHHSDTEMTWLTLSRFHPINRTTTTCIDVACLAILGFPAWALVANELVRHYYGEFIHADLPWMYGPFRKIFVSPVMHRWHHARDVTGTGSNFATVFSVFDRAFGTYYVPGLCVVPLGVTDDVGPGVIRQILYPFVFWASNILRAARSSRSSVTSLEG